LKTASNLMTARVIAHLHSKVLDSSLACHADRELNENDCLHEACLIRFLV
jgi:hypothetical protein